MLNIVGNNRHCTPRSSSTVTMTKSVRAYWNAIPRFHWVINEHTYFPSHKTLPSVTRFLPGSHLLESCWRSAVGSSQVHCDFNCIEDFCSEKKEEICYRCTTSFLNYALWTTFGQLKVPSSWSIRSHRQFCAMLPSQCFQQRAHKLVFARFDKEVDRTRHPRSRLTYWHILESLDGPSSD